MFNKLEVIHKVANNSRVDNVYPKMENKIDKRKKGRRGRMEGGREGGREGRK